MLARPLGVARLGAGERKMGKERREGGKEGRNERVSLRAVETFPQRSIALHERTKLIQSLAAVRIETKGRGVARVEGSTFIAHTSSRSRGSRISINLLV